MSKFLCVIWRTVRVKCPLDAQQFQQRIYRTNVTRWFQRTRYVHTLSYWPNIDNGNCGSNVPGRRFHTDNALYGSDDFGTLAPEFIGKDSKSKHLKTKRKKYEGAKRKIKSGQMANMDSGEMVDKTFEDDLSNTFGTMVAEEESEWRAGKMREEREMSVLEDVDDRPYLRLSSFGRKNTPYWYAKKIEQLGKEGKVKEAIDTLEVDMLKEDRVMPTVHAYSALIGILGRVGYTKKAFSLFNQMKKRKLVPDGPVYTGLFNACANSPWREDGLQRADNLRELMRDKEVLANAVNYKAMMKVYAVHGELQTAFSLLDESIRQGHIPDKEAFSFLLMACVSDKQAGFKHAIEVWRIMRKQRIVPDTYHYNLLLRTVRDCGIGSRQYANTLVGKRESLLFNRNEAVPKSLPVVDVAQDEQISGHTVAEREDGKIANRKDDEFDSLDNIVYGEIDGESNAVTIAATVEETARTPMVTDVPNILNPKGKWKDVVALARIVNSRQRLDLLGGCDGVLSHMSRDNTKPDIKTFSQLLDIMPSKSSVEDMLIGRAEAYGVELDSDFFSLMMRRRNLRKDFAGAKDLLDVMASRKLYPNIRTFGCLAMGCKRKTDGVQLIANIKENGLVPNIEIFNILIYQSDMDFFYKLELCRQMKKHAVLPEEKTLARIEMQINKAKRMVLKMERIGNEVPERFKSVHFGKGFKAFMLFYKTWLKEMEYDAPDHPWKQFREKIPEADAAFT